MGADTTGSTPGLLSRRQVLGGIAAGTGLLLLRAPGAQAAPPNSPRVAYGPDSTRSLRLAWSTPGPVRDLVAEIGPDARLGHRAPVTTSAVSSYGIRYHHALVEGLQPGTTYHYRLSHKGGSTAGTATTAPARPTPFRFVAFGDQGEGNDAATVDATVRRERPDLVFVVGDLSYASKTGGLTPNLPGVVPVSVDNGAWDRWLALTSRSGAAGTPWLCGVGNHEIEDGGGDLGYDGYLARVPLPGNGPRHVPTAWTARYGNVAFVNLDANDVSYEITRNAGWTGGHQTRWLARTLKALRADAGVDWIVVGFHHCAYCSNAVHGSDGGVRDAWGALFDQHQVDLVVNGHNHCYERAHPIRGGEVAELVRVGDRFPSERGTTYITAGGGGQATYPTFTPLASYLTDGTGLKIPELISWSSLAVATQSVLVVDVVPPDAGGTTTLALSAVRGDGTAFDRVTLVRQRGPASAPPATAPIALPRGRLPQPLLHR
jgi:hypothetical protein